MIDSNHPEEEFFFDEWEEEEADDLGPPPPRWRRSVLIAVAAVTAIAMGMIPLYNVIFATTVADNGLEVCGFDYCVVQEGVRAARLDLTMSRLSNSFLDEGEARALANELTDHLGIESIGLDVVEDLDGRLGGVYDRDSRSISIESPARAWTVLHEVAHAVEPGHGVDFQEVVIDLAAFMESQSAG